MIKSFLRWKVNKLEKLFEPLTISVEILFLYPRSQKTNYSNENEKVQLNKLVKHERIEKSSFTILMIIVSYIRRPT